MNTYTELHSNNAEDNWGTLYYHVLPKIINENNLKTGAEIGVAFGGHINSILQNTKVDKMYGIDAYQAYHNTTDSFSWEGIQYSQKEYDDLYEYTKNRLEKYGNRCILLRKSSEEASVEIIEPLDFIFIDAQHTYDDVLKDLHLWFNKIKDKGIVAGHDYCHPNFPGVKTAVDEFFTEKKLTINSEDGYVWWVKKG